MGYYVRHTGRITITPPLTHADAARTPTTQDVYLVRDGADAVAIAVRDEPIKGIDLDVAIKAILDEHPAHFFKGRIDCEGEDDGATWHMIVRERNVAKVGWPPAEWMSG